MSALNAAVLGQDGDPFYGSGALAEQVKSKRLCLHASELTLPHPSKSELLRFESQEAFPDWGS